MKQSLAGDDKIFEDDPFNQNFDKKGKLFLNKFLNFHLPYYRICPPLISQYEHQSTT